MRSPRARGSQLRRGVAAPAAWALAACLVVTAGARGQARTRPTSRPKRPQFRQYIYQAVYNGGFEEVSFSKKTKGIWWLTWEEGKLASERLATRLVTGEKARSGRSALKLAAAGANAHQPFSYYRPASEGIVVRGAVWLPAGGGAIVKLRDGGLLIGGGKAPRDKSKTRQFDRTLIYYLGGNPPAEEDPKVSYIELPEVPHGRWHTFEFKAGADWRRLFGEPPSGQLDLQLAHGGEGGAVYFDDIEVRVPILTLKSDAEVGHWLLDEVEWALTQAMDRGMDRQGRPTAYLRTLWNPATGKGTRELPQGIAMSLQKMLPMYLRFRRNERMAELARKQADLYLETMLPDAPGVPRWDFATDAPVKTGQVNPLWSTMYLAMMYELTGDARYKQGVLTIARKVARTGRSPLDAIEAGSYYHAYDIRTGEGVRKRGINARRMKYAFNYGSWVMTFGLRVAPDDPVLLAALRDNARRYLSFRGGHSPWMPSRKLGNFIDPFFDDYFGHNSLRMTDFWLDSGKKLPLCGEIIAPGVAEFLDVYPEAMQRGWRIADDGTRTCNAFVAHYRHDPRKFARVPRMLEIAADYYMKSTTGPLNAWDAADWSEHFTLNRSERPAGAGNFLQILAHASQPDVCGVTDKHRAYLVTVLQASIDAFKKPYGWEVGPGSGGVGFLRLMGSFDIIAANLLPDTDLRRAPARQRK